MDNEKRFLAAVREAGIERVLIVDDALAPPEFREIEDAGPLAEILGDGTLAVRLAARDIGAELAQAALNALTGSEFDAEEIGRVWTLLYDAFVDRPVTKLDPGGRFETVKGDNARALRPFILLLGKCDPAISLVRVGAPDAELDFKTLRPQMVFLDYILNENVSVGNAQPDADEKKTGVSASRELLKRIVKELPSEGPAVVLMSSYASVKDEANNFRRGIGGGLFTSRFQFVDKGKLAIEGGKVAIQPDAAGTLLDLAQCRSFGVELNEALAQWRKGVDKAINDVFSDIGDLELRDLAYLIRFRLDDEGQPLSDYLEWFFGEVLLDRIGGSVAWTHPSFVALNRPIDGPGRHIEGMFDGATSKIAEMFSRVRIDKRSIDAPRDRRMGDLYTVEGSPDEVCAVITPDCDLIQRKATGPRAKRILTVSGRLHPIEAPNVTAADFVMHGNQPYSVAWDTKDLRTLPFGAERQHPPGMTHAGTMRPLYALELQRRVLDDVGRVGLAIAPALNYTALSSAFQAVSGKLTKVDLGDLTGAACSVMPSRGGSDKATIVFHRGFVERLQNALASLTYEGADAGSKAWVKKVKGTAWQDAVTAKLLGSGIEDGEPFEGLVVAIREKPAKLKDQPAMCQIIVQPMPTESDGETAAAAPADPSSAPPTDAAPNAAVQGAAAGTQPAAAE